MPRFPDYDPESGQGLQFPVAAPSQVPAEAAAYQARVDRQNAFDDEERFNQRRQQRQAELDEAARTMPPAATGFAAGIMQSTQKGDSALLAAVSPANRPAFAARLAAEREALLGQAAAIERQGRARYEAGELDNAFAAHEQDVARDPSLLATARQAYFGLVDSSGQTPAQKAQRRQDAERGLAMAAWRTRFADDPEGGAAALDRNDPAFAAIPKAEHDQLIGDAFLRRDQNQALARGALEPTLRDAETALTSVGRYDGVLPDEARFVAAYGREDGPRRHAEFQRIVKLGADVDAIKTMTPAEQTAWLARLGPKAFEFTGNGPDFVEGRERHARAAQAIALNLAARNKNPNAYVRAVYPAIDKLWTEAENSPDRLKAALAATNAAMDGLGLPAQGRAVLPKAMIDKALMRFGDTARPLSERIAPFRALITAPDDPAQQAGLFAQAMRLGLPRLAAPALAAYGRGDDDNAARLLLAAFGTNTAFGNRHPQPAAGAKLAQPADSAASTAPTSPLALRGGAGAAGTRAAWQPVRTDTAIDLGPAMASELARLQAAGRNGLDPLTAKLFDNIVQNTLSLNGGDPYDAVARASQAIRRASPSLYAAAQPRTVTDVQPGVGMAQDNGGARVTGSTPNKPANPPFEIPEGSGKPANVNTAPAIPASPGATVDNAGKAVIQRPGATTAKPVNDNALKTLPPQPRPANPDRQRSTQPRSLPPSANEMLRRNPGSRGADPLGLLLFDEAKRPQDASAPYPDSPVPSSYSLSPFGGTRIGPAITGFIQRQVEALPRRDDVGMDAHAKSAEFGDFNTALVAARRDLFADQVDGSYRPYYTVGDYDFSFARGPNADSEATVVAVRKSKREAAWFSGWFVHDEGAPAGPWSGTPAPEIEPAPATEPKLGTVPLGSQRIPKIPQSEQQRNSPLGAFGIFPTPAQPPILNSPAGGEDGENGPEPLVEPLPPSPPDQPFFPSDYYAARKAGLTRQQALDTAISNYRNKGSGFETYKGGASPPTVPPRPPQDPSDPYDEKKYDSELILTGSPRAALKAARNAYRSAPPNKGTDGLPVPTVSNKSPKSPSYPPPVLGPGEHIDMADYSYHRDAKMNTADALEAAKADLQKRIKDASQGGAAPTVADYPLDGEAPKPANDETSWVRFLRAAIIQGYADWTVRERQQQIETGIQQRQPDVTVAGVTDGAPVFSMSQKARFDYNAADQDSLAADEVRLDKARRDKFGGRPMTNEALKNSHGEIVVIQKLHEAGQTEGKLLYLVVNGRDVCGWCERDIPRAASAAKLKGVIIYETATGHTKYWHPDMEEIMQAEENSQ
ncbi:hypothetical protein C5L14_21170 [Labrys okinawensis]|uniref:Putative cytidine deaminase C-terminal domain-containing protein n=1 Tax=Labrys okinawensis TaxID=346911 RepID=A0A2S9Q820_9HYPH|nr:hypothetical protein [Labrys okinawensis]PRH85502.1 hypothetical protein C5L14_21170 [Labrys okinawensis]